MGYADLRFGFAAGLTRAMPLSAVAAAGFRMAFFFGGGD
jgi:hypothetical protein